MTAENGFDFGLSGLSTQFHQDTVETPLELARLWAESDAVGLQADIDRLLEVPLPDWALTALWRAASGMVGMEESRTGSGRSKPSARPASAPITR
ncbi:hypothetical protein ACFQ0M_41430 [Kitasatospora aburaviensis]